MGKGTNSALYGYLLLVGLLLTSGCYRQDVITVDIHVPQMREAECSRIIIRVLRDVEGIQSLRPDVEGRILRVTYNSRILALKNIEHALANQGFTANDVEAHHDARMRLPAECQ